MTAASTAAKTELIALVNLYLTEKCCCLNFINKECSRNSAHHPLKGGYVLKQALIKWNLIVLPFKTE